jgi:lysine 6-dehydrogenase
MKNITVLGGGLVGATIARDLSARHRVTILDIKGHPSVDLSKDFTQHIRHADLVINALPGSLGYSALQTVIRAGKNCVDISFFEEDPFSLDALAKEYGATIAVDCGVAPGMCNMILDYEARFAPVHSYVCTVGGLPVVRTLPFQYKAPYSPSDVIEFYLRPARIKMNGKREVVPALSDIALENTCVGTLESFNTDGLRTLLTTMTDVESMRERTYRYPGTAQLINTLKDAGFFDREAIQMTTEVLRRAWKLEPGEDEFTIMKVLINDTIEWRLYDKRVGEDSSMARVTGFTCNAVAELMLSGAVGTPGIHAPEKIAAQENNFEFILEYARERDVIYTRRENTA